MNRIMQDHSKSPINVLVVDDSLVIRGIVSTVLESDSGITVVDAVATTAEANVVMARHLIDVVTLDIEMPGGNGLDFLPSLVRRRIPAVMLSSKTTQGSREAADAMSRGAHACFNKAEASSQSLELINCVKEAARRKPAPARAVDSSVEDADPIAVTLRRLVAKHGKDVSRFIAERIGYAVLAEDRPAVTNWVSLARHLDDLLGRSIGSPLSLAGTSCPPTKD